MRFLRTWFQSMLLIGIVTSILSHGEGLRARLAPSTIGRSAWAALLAGLLLHSSIWADALVVTQAMKATTIAEIFVEQDQIRVEIEIGADDLEAFQNVLPDKLYETLTGQSEPLRQRIGRFLSEDWVVIADQRPLDGTIEQIKPDRRLLRDEITGDPLPNQPDDVEHVIRVHLVYPCSNQPSSIAISPLHQDDQSSSRANIGFVAYHEGIAVNDFRYLARKETLRLDWLDPWYSAFEQKTLRRRYYAPAAAFLYVESFEVRKEIVIRPKDLQTWIDLGLEGKSSIAADQRDGIKAKAADFLGQHTPVRIDGRSAEGRLDRIHFINRSLRTTGVVEPGQDIDLNRAMLGAIFVYSIDDLPNEVSMKWDLFSDRIQQIPSVATDEAGGMPGAIDASDGSLVWKNYLKNPTRPAFLELARAEDTKVLPVPMVSVVIALVAGLVWWRATRPTLAVTLLGIALIALLIPALRWNLSVTTHAEPTPKQARDVTYSLLHNVYRAFDYRDEETVYDLLARSAAGDLLNQIYLETRQSLTLASQGGARVKVTEIELARCEASCDQQGRLTADCTWNVTGSVGHWGHLHQRRNQYNGRLMIEPVDGQWKITTLEVLSEERL